MKIKISEIEKLPEDNHKIKFSEIMEEFNKKEPVEADFKIEFQGSLIEVSGNIKAKVNLICDYCLEEFTKEYNLKAEEYFERESLNDGYDKEFEIKEDNFVQDLNGSDEIDLTDLIYQIITLHIPNQLVCGINCKGRESIEKYLHKDSIDPRLEIFKTIKTDKE